MKHKKYFRAAALVLAVLLALGLAACGGDGAGSQSQSGGSSMQGYQPPATGSSNTQNEPDATNPPAVTTGITGIWQDGPSVFAFYSDFVLAYEFGSGDDGDLRFGYLKNLYDGSYTLSGNTLSLSLYELDGTMVHTGDFVLDGDTLRSDVHEIVKVSDNTGAEGDLVGTWHSLGDRFEFDAFKGTRMEFYNDGTCSASLDDGSGRNDGSYVLTSQYDLPAVTLYDEYGNVCGTYPYEFLENDLLMIYVYDIDFGGYVFYRAS